MVTTTKWTLNLPSAGVLNWNIPLNANFELIDSILYKLRTNFSSATPPTESPDTGSLWYDSANSKLKLKLSSSYVPLLDETYANTLFSKLNGSTYSGVHNYSNASILWSSGSGSTSITSDSSGNINFRFGPSISSNFSKFSFYDGTNEIELFKISRASSIFKNTVLLDNTYIGAVELNIVNRSNANSAVSQIKTENDLGSAGTFSTWGSGNTIGTVAGENVSNNTTITSTNSLILSTQLSSPLILGTSNIERMRILSNGYVGIGTNNPQYILDIQEDKNGYAGIRVKNSNTGVGAASRLDIVSGTTSLTTEVFGPSFFVNPSAVTFYTNATNGMIFGTSQDAPLKFITKNTTKMAITGSGNFGFGTSNPSYPFDFISNQSADAITRFRNPNNGNNAASKLIVNCDTSDLLLEVYGPNHSTKSNKSSIKATSSSSFGIGNSSATGSLQLITNDTERVTITNTGNVGIGTIAPAEKLEVAGNAKVSGTLAIDGATIHLNYASSGYNRNIYGSTNGSYRWGMRLGNSSVESGSNVGSDFELNRYDDVGSYIESVVYIRRNNGKVGIGTVPAIEKLEVAGNIKAINNSSMIMSPFTSTQGLFNGYASAAGTYILDINAIPTTTTDAASVRFFRGTNTTGTVALRVLKGDGSTTENHILAGNADTFLCANNGKIRIGDNTTPTEKLEVLGVGKFTQGIKLGSGTVALSNYEEGTWQPTISGTTVAGANTYSVREGRYTRIGRVVYISCRITLSAKDAEMSGSVIITGLPFVVKNIVTQFAANIAFLQRVGYPTTAGFIPAAWFSQNTQMITLSHIRPNDTILGLDSSAIIATSDIGLSGWYEI